MLLTLLLVVSIILNVLFGVAINRQMFKVGIYEEYITEIKSKILNAYQQIMNVHLAEAFESDDEVGASFKTIKDLVESLKTEVVDDDRS